uniref:Uncharacterized protein n=1 Tax=viral metagenome TaxID=1070528 RepID=A0A6C0H2J3_9ZZZZ
MPPKKIKTQAELAKEAIHKQKVAKANREKKSIETAPLRGRMKEKVLDDTVTNEFQQKSITKNEDSIRAFFKTLKDLPDEEVAKRMNIFFKERVTGRSKQFENIIKVLPSRMYKNLAEEHLKQTDKTLNLFWSDYKVRKHVIEAMQEKEREDELESQALEKISETQPKEKKKEKKKEKYVAPVFAKAKFIDDDGVETEIKKSDINPSFHDPKKRKEPTMTISITPLENCVKASYLKDVIKTFITPIGDAEQKAQLEKFIRADQIESRTERGEKWYIIDERLSLILCKSYRYWSDNSVTAILHPGGRKIYFKIGYLLKNGTFETQTIEKFKEEKYNIDNIRRSRGRDIANILKSPKTSEIERFVRSVLSDWLTTIAPDVKEYKDADDTEGYVYEAVQRMSKESRDTRDLFVRLANITLFLQNKDSLFADRVRDGVYIPAILVSLSIEDKLPEIFDDPTSDKLSAKRFIEKQIESIVKQFGELLYKRENASDSVPTAPKAAILPSFNATARPWKSACENKLDDNVKNSEVVYYQEDGKVYCLLIRDVYKQIKNGEEPINPMTQNPLDNTFLEKFKELYDHKFGGDEDIVEEVSIKTVSRRPPIVTKKGPPIAPWLLDTIIKNIKGCEDELKSGKNTCESIEKDPESDSDDSSESDESIREVKSGKKSSLFDSSSSDDGREIKEEDGSEIRSEDGDEEEEDGSEVRSEEEDEDEEEEDGSEDGSEHSPRSCTQIDVIEGDICQHCKKKLTKRKKLSSPKTMVRNKNGNDTLIWLCDLDCFEKYTCPRFKTKRKGGRNASQDRKKKKK